MKAKCIKTDTLGWLVAGEVYEIEIIGDNYVPVGSGTAISRENFNEMFEEVKQ